MPDVPRKFAEHSLHVRPDAKPVKQGLRRFAEEKRRAIGEEIARLLTAGFIGSVSPGLVVKPSPSPKEERHMVHVR